MRESQRGISQKRYRLKLISQGLCVRCREPSITHQCGKCSKKRNLLPFKDRFERSQKHNAKLMKENKRLRLLIEKTHDKIKILELELQEAQRERKSRSGHPGQGFWVH